MFPRLRHPQVVCWTQRFAKIKCGKREMTSAPKNVDDLVDWRDIKSYKWFLPIQTRWKDNDQYGHVNNAVYQSYFDSVANVFLIRHCGLIPTASAPMVGTDPLDKGADHSIAFIAECYSQFFAPISHPDVYMVGMAVSHLGNSSIRYRLGLFKFLELYEDLPLDLVTGYFSSQLEQRGLALRIDTNALAAGSFVHVVVDKNSHSPKEIPAKWREHLRKIAMP